jgi:hypothetical protein
MITKHPRYAKTTYEKGYKVYKQWFFDLKKRPEEVLEEVQREFQSGSEAELDASNVSDENENQLENQLEVSAKNYAKNSAEHNVDSSRRLQRLELGSFEDETGGYEEYKLDQNGVKQGRATYEYRNGGIWVGQKSGWGDSETYRYAGSEVGIEEFRQNLVGISREFRRTGDLDFVEACMYF